MNDNNQNLDENFGQFGKEIDDIFDSKEDYIKTLEMSVNILQNELRETVARLASEEKSENPENGDFNNDLIDFPNFSDCENIEEVFNFLFNFLNKYINSIELELFLIDENNSEKNDSESYNFLKINEIHSSLTLEYIYKELEERGLIDWALSNEDVKIIPNFEENNELIKSIVIIPLKIQKKQTGFFLANSTNFVEDFHKNQLEIVSFVALQAFYLINSIKIQNNKTNSSIEYDLLKSQTLLASNQIALSEIVMILNEELELPLKVIKMNFDLINKGVGDIGRRIEILSEQFKKILNYHKLMNNFGNFIEYLPTNHQFLEIINQSIEIIEPQLSKNGISIDKKIEITNEEIKCFKGQLIFSILNIIINSISSMPDGGKIHLGVYKNDDSTQLTLILTNDGIGIENLEINGNLISLSDISYTKIHSKFQFLISQHIICQHKGKFSIYSDVGKGTTYKIILPII